jgi:hypothetical protein
MIPKIEQKAEGYKNVCEKKLTKFRFAKHVGEWANLAKDQRGAVAVAGSLGFQPGIHRL